MSYNSDKASLGEWADKGYSLKDYPDHTVTVEFKGKEIAAFPKHAVTPLILQDACWRHEHRLNNVVGVV